MKPRKILLTISLILSALCVFAQAPDNFRIGNLHYYGTSYNGEHICTVVPVDRNINGEISIPSTVYREVTNVTYTVTKVGYFNDCKNITSVIIPNSVTYIESFEGCINLTSVNIPSSVTHIGSFKGCINLTSVVIPNSMNSIGSNLFYGCSSLASVKIPSSVKKIDRYAFAGCSSLTSITIPNEVTMIYDGCFKDCINLTSVIIPSSVSIISIYAFSGCTNLTSITIPNSVRTISNNAFSECRSLKDVIVNWEKPLSISNNLFSGYIFSGVDVSSVILHVPCGTRSLYQAADGWKSFGTIADGCAPTLSVSSSSLNFSAKGGQQTFNITSNIDWTVNSDREWLTVSSVSGSNNEKITLTSVSNTMVTQRTATVTISGKDVPEQKINVIQEGTQNRSKIWDLSATMSATLDEEGLLTISTTQNAEDMPDYNNVDDVPWASVTSEIYKVLVKENVTSIGGFAFNGCGNLTSASIPNSVTFFSFGAFQSCSKLLSITIPKKQTVLYGYTFNLCNSLTSITIPKSVTSFGDRVFKECKSLTDVTVEWTTPLVVEGGRDIFFATDLSAVTLHVPAGTKALYQAAEVWKDFGTITDGTDSSKTWNLSATMTAILDEDGLLTISTTQSSEDMPDYNNVDNVPWASVTSEIYKVLVEENVASIGGFAFNDCRNLTSVSIPNSVTSFGFGAFQSCSRLTSITIPKTQTTVYGYTFHGCSGLTSITIPKSVTSFGHLAFQGCINLTDVTVEWATPLVIEADREIFRSINLSAVTLHVPAGTKALYQAADVWKDFGTITDGTDVPATSVVIGKKNVTLAVDSAAQLTVTVLPTNATNKKVTWSSSNESVASVSATGLVMARKEGTAMITVTTQDGQLKDSCEVEVKRQKVIVDEEIETGADGKGKIVLSLTIPIDELFSGLFHLTLPTGVQLDMDYTRLSDNLSAELDLKIEKESNGSWLFTITPKTLRNAGEMVYSEIMEIGYIVDETVEEGIYEATVNNLSFEFENGSKIVTDKMPVKINVGQVITGIPVFTAETNVFIQNGRLYVDSPVTETIQVYSISGALLYHHSKSAGKTNFTIANAQSSVLIVKGSSGWTRKVVGL